MNRTENRVRVLGVMTSDIERWWLRAELAAKIGQRIHSTGLNELLRGRLIEVNVQQLRGQTVYTWRVTPKGIEAYKEWSDRGPKTHPTGKKVRCQECRTPEPRHKMDCSGARNSVLG